MIFELFYKADLTMTRKFVGSCLAQAISKNLIELMEVNMDCKNQQNVGTVFKNQI